MHRSLYMSAHFLITLCVYAQQVNAMLSAPPCGDPWVKWSISSHMDSLCAEADCRFVYVVLSTGCWLMAPLSACQARKSVDDLRPSQRSCHHLARRAKRRTRSWNVGTWNVRSTCMVDTEGSVAILLVQGRMDREKIKKLTWLLESWEDIMWIWLVYRRQNGLAVMYIITRNRGHPVAISVY